MITWLEYSDISIGNTFYPPPKQNPELFFTLNLNHVLVNLERLELGNTFYFPPRAFNPPPPAKY